MKEPMKIPHKHAEVIKAWADGATIQHRGSIGVSWQDALVPSWSFGVEYRVKPEPKPDNTLHVNACITNHNISGVGISINISPNLSLTFDGETGKLKSVELIQ